ncbi:hypothetical protein AgCh_039628 [Apium graveolens]
MYHRGAAAAIVVYDITNQASLDREKKWVQELLSQEELVGSNHLEDANKVFLKGAVGGLRATDQLYDMIIEEDCKVGDHSNALTISYEMEAAGRMATTFMQALKTD